MPMGVDLRPFPKETNEDACNLYFIEDLSDGRETPRSANENNEKLNIAYLQQASRDKISQCFN